METNIRLSKKQKRLRLLILTGIYALMAAIISLSVLFYINYGYFAKMDNSAVTSGSGETASNTSNSKLQAKAGISCNAGNISFSFDNKYCMYLIDGKVCIKEIQTNLIRHEISEDIPISNAVILDDRNIIVYFTMSKDGTIQIKTYNIDNNETTEQKTFKVGSGSNIKEVGYSSLSGYIFINVENMSTNKSDKVYYITLMKKVRKLTTEKIVDNMVMLSKTFSLYYQDNNGILFCNSKKIHGFESKKINLLGRDSKDNVYIQSFFNTNTIYVLNNNKVIRTIYLNDTKYLKIFCDRTAIYAVYNGYAVNLADDINKKILFSNKFSFVNIVNNRIYLRSKSNMVIWNNI